MIYINKIKELREYQGLTQSELARLSGLTPAAISQIESSKRVPTLKTFKKISDALGVKIEYFIKERKTTTPNEKLIEEIKAKNITKRDIAEILRFVDFLQYSKAKNINAKPN